MNSSEVRVYLLDDEPDVTRALAWLLDSIHVPSTAFSSPHAFLREFDFFASPVCLVLDLRMPEMGGLEVMQKLMELKYDLPVIFLSAHGDIPAAVRAMQLGAMDFLQKPFKPQDFLDCVNKAILAARKNFEQWQAKEATERFLQRLSSRERQVFHHLLDGATSKEIARSLNISYKTVDVHRSNVLRKLEVRSYLELKRKFWTPRCTKWNLAAIRCTACGSE